MGAGQDKTLYTSHPSPGDDISRQTLMTQNWRPLLADRHGQAGRDGVGNSGRAQGLPFHQQIDRR